MPQELDFLYKLAGLNPKQNFGENTQQPQALAGGMMQNKMPQIMQQQMMNSLIPQDNGSRSVNSLLPLLNLLAKGGKPKSPGMDGMVGDFGTGATDSMLA